MPCIASCGRSCEQSPGLGPRLPCGSRSLLAVRDSFARPSFSSWLISNPNRSFHRLFNGLLEGTSIFLDRSANRILTDALVRFLDDFTPSAKGAITKLVKDLNLEDGYG